MNPAVKIFGREPAAWVGLIEAVLAVAVSFGLGLDSEHAALVMAVIVALFGVYTAFATKDTMLGVIVGLAKALIALGIGYGLTLSVDQTGVLIALVTIAVGFFQRTQTSPVIDSTATVLTSARSEGTGV